MTKNERISDLEVRLEQLEKKVGHDVGYDALYGYRYGRTGIFEQFGLLYDYLKVERVASDVKLVSKAK